MQYICIIFLLYIIQNKIFKLLSKKIEADLIRNTLLNDKEIAAKKENKAIKQEELKRQIEALEIFNYIDSNKNKKYTFCIIVTY